MIQSLARAIAINLLCTTIAMNSAAGEEFVESAALTWAAWGDEITTAKIEYAGASVAVTLKPLSCEEVREIFIESNLVEDLTSFERDIAPKLFDAEKVKINLKAGRIELKPATLWVDGEKYRDETARGIYLSDGFDQIVTSTHQKQIDVFRSSGRSRGATRLSDFRLCPPLSMDRTSAIRILRDADQVVHVQIGLHGHDEPDLIIDRDSKAVLEAYRRNDDGSVVAHALYMGWVTWPGDIYFPTISIESSYLSTGLAGHIKIRRITDAIFNQPVEREVAFTVGATPEVAVADYRNDPSHPSVFRVESPLADVLSVREDGNGHLVSRTDELSGNEVRSSRWKLLLAGNLLVAFGLYLFRRAKRRRIVQ